MGAGVLDNVSILSSAWGEYPVSIVYRIVNLYAQAGDEAQSFAWLEKSLAIPLANRARIAADEAFAAWRGDERFRKLAGLAPKRSVSREEGWTYYLEYLVAEIRRLHYSYRTNPLPRAGLKRTYAFCANGFPSFPTRPWDPKSSDYSHV